jgi:signal transduction histidine kinase
MHNATRLKLAHPRQKAPAPVRFILWCATAVFLLTSSLGRGGEPVHQGTNWACLTNAQQIRCLTSGEAQKGFPVRLRAVVTFYDPRPNDLFVQDATAGIYVLADPKACANFSAGQEIEVVGSTGAGDFAPIVKAQSMQVIGAAPLPVPRLARMSELFTGREDSQRIEVCGIVRSATDLADRNYLNLAMDELHLIVFIEHIDRTNAAQLLTKYLGATVRVRGVCYSRYNMLGQFRMPWVAATSLDDVSIVSPCPDQPSEVSVADLAHFNSSGYFGQRVKLQGVVTALKDDGAVFLQDHGAGICVLPAQPTALAPGDRITASGYTALGDYVPVLEDATVEILAHRAATSAIAVNLKSLLESPEKYDYALVRVEANLINLIAGPSQLTLVLEASNSVMTAGIENRMSDEFIKSLRNGSRLTLTGVFNPQSSQKWIPGFIPSRERSGGNSFRFPPESVQILLRTSNDVVVLHQPSWWTLARLLWVVGIMTLALLIGVAWVVALDRRVRRQTQTIGEKVRREGVLEERDRLAREFHDTLEQELVAITMQLDAIKAQSANTTPTQQRHLELARNMSRRSLSEARRSVLALRSHLLENCTLETALKEIAAPLFHETNIEVAFTQTGPARKLPALTEHNLLRIGQEGLSNAFKHSHARQIKVSIAYESEQVRLRISDDGSGFDVETAGAARHGHFGLLDMRERAEKIGGTLTLVSQHGAGTDLTITVFSALVPSLGPGILTSGSPSSAFIGKNEGRP